MQFTPWVERTILSCCQRLRYASSQSRLSAVVTPWPSAKLPTFVARRKFSLSTKWLMVASGSAGGTSARMAKTGSE